MRVSLPPLPLLTLLLLAGLTSCVQTAKDRYDPTKPYQVPYSGPDLEPGQVVSQGMIGASTFEEIAVSGNGHTTTTDETQLPMIAGAFQWPLWGEQVDAGLEMGG